MTVYCLSLARAAQSSEFLLLLLQSCLQITNDLAKHTDFRILTLAIELTEAEVAAFRRLLATSCHHHLVVLGRGGFDRSNAFPIFVGVHQAALARLAWTS
eukprot:Skav220549  [mRNA]  locus=scaffold761:104481:108461:+ [translate_table: standard]